MIEHLTQAHDRVLELDLPQNPDSIAILSGGIKKHIREEGEMYLPTSYKDGLGGKGRIIAASKLAEVFPNSPLLTLSHVDPTVPSQAEIYHQELVRQGIDTSRIIKDPDAYNTFSELVAIQRQAQLNAWKNVIVVTNNYHLPRTSYMLEHFEDLARRFQLTEPLQPHTLTLRLVGAEDILTAFSPHYTSLIDAWMKTPSYAKLVELEEKGLQDLQTNTYFFTSRNEAILTTNNLRDRMFEDKKN